MCLARSTRFRGPSDMCPWIPALLIALFRSMYIPMATQQGAKWNARRLGMAEVPVLLIGCAAVLMTVGATLAG